MRRNTTQNICSTLVIVTVAFVGGCGLFGPPFSAGTYSADVPCTLSAGLGDGAPSESFFSTTSLEVRDDGSLWLNGVHVAVGERISFSIPTADLAFEITSVERDLFSVTVTFEPRPTLPGISIEGSLVETFTAESGAVHAVAGATFDVTDTSTTTTLHISCAGTLQPQ